MNKNILIFLIIVVIISVIVIMVYFIKKKINNKKQKENIEDGHSQINNEEFKYTPLFNNLDEKYQLTKEIEKTNKDFTNSIKQNLNQFLVKNEDESKKIAFNNDSEEKAINIPKFENIGIFSNQNFSNKEPAKKFTNRIGIDRRELNNYQNDIQTMNINDLDEENKNGILKNKAFNKFQPIKPNLSIALRNDPDLLNQYARLENKENPIKKIDKSSDKSSDKKLHSSEKTQLNNNKRKK